MSEKIPPVKAQQLIFPVSFFGSDGTLLLNPTLAAGDVIVSTDFGAFGNLNTLPTISPSNSGQAQVTVSAGEMNGDVVRLQFVDQTSPKEWQDFTVSIYPVAQQLKDLLATSGYTAPDNADIATILTRTDVATSTRLASVSYTAPDNADIVLIKAKTDQLNFTSPGEVDANVQAVNDTQLKGDGSGVPWGPV